MADTRAATGLTVQQWDDKFFVEHILGNRFSPYMGDNENSIIQIKDDLTKKDGDSLTFALLNRLTGDGVTGTNTLEGNEEDLVSRSFRVYVDKLRHGVRVAEMEEQRSAIGLRDAARASLKTWMQERTRDDIIDALGSINGVLYASASAAQRNAWMVDNVDRVLIGALKSNYSATHATALANVDNTDDKLTPAALSLMKRIALEATPKIRPVMGDDGEENYVVFAGTRTFRDLSLNSTMTQANREARLRGVENPLFKGADLLWDGLVIKQVPDIPTYAEGAAGISIAPVYLCGAQALAIAYAKRTTSKTEPFDYGDKNGIAIEEIRGIKKMLFGSGAGDTDDLKDHGLVTGWFAAVADA